MPKSTRKTRQTTSEEPIADAERSLIDWRSLPHATLVLKCGEHNLTSKGKKENLVNRLFDFFHPSSDEPSNKENVTPAAEHPSTSTGILAFQPVTLMPNNVNNHASASPNQNATAGTVDATMICEAIATLQDQQKTHAEQQQLLQVSLQKLLQQNDGTSAQAAVATQPIIVNPVSSNAQLSGTQLINNPLPTNINVLGNRQQVQESTLPANTQNLVDYHPQQAVHFNIDSVVPGHPAPVHGFNSHQHLLPSTTAGRANHPFHPNNPYLPPPVTPQILTKIRNKEYVDFGAVLFPIIPSPSSMASVIEGEEAEEYCLSQSREAGSAASFIKKSSRTAIPNYATWVLAWNVFYEATLHYYPDMAYELFCYFKHIAEYAQKYTFKYLAAYDRTHRVHIAAQRHLPVSVQTSSWTKHDPSLFNSYLRDNMHPSCGNCFTYGHFDKQCTLPATNSTKRRQNNSNQQYHPPAPVDYSQFATSQNAPPLTPTQFWNAQGSNAPQPLLSNSSNIINVPRSSVPRPNAPYCHRYNDGRRCNPPCDFTHACKKCFEAGRPAGHPRYLCTK